MSPEGLVRNRRTVETAAIAVFAAVLTSCSAPPASPPTPPVVTYAHAIAAQVTPWESFTGRLEAAEEVVIRPRVAGELRRVVFAEGADVRAGDLLAEVDARPFAAATKAAEARLARARTRAAQAVADAARAERLLVAQAVSREEGEARLADAEASAADVQAAEAALQAARLEQDWTRVRAPISGRIGRVMVKAGNLVSDRPDATPITTIVTMDPLRVVLAVNERAYLGYLAARDSGAPLRATLELADGSQPAADGRIEFVDNQLDARTGTVRMHAVFPNRDRRLAPGLFARVKLQTGRAHRALVVPERAIGIDQDRRYVMVMKADSTVEHRQVEIGAQDGARRIIVKGLQAGEAIVVAGQQRIRPGMKVQGQHAMPEPTALAAR